MFYLYFFLNFVLFSVKKCNKSSSWHFSYQGLGSSRASQGSMEENQKQGHLKLCTLIRLGTALKGQPLQSGNTPVTRSPWKIYHCVISISIHNFTDLIARNWIGIAKGNFMHSEGQKIWVQSAKWDSVRTYRVDVDSSYLCLVVQAQAL